MSSKQKIIVGGVQIGGGAGLVIQSMCNTKTHDVEATVEQILRLEEAGFHLRHRVGRIDVGEQLKRILRRGVGKLLRPPSGGYETITGALNLCEVLLRMLWLQRNNLRAD